MKQLAVLARAWRPFKTSSLAEATRMASKLEALELKASPDLICSNLMCEKVGEPCVCRLALLLWRAPNLVALDLSDNRLKELPDNLWSLSRLESLDVSGNGLPAADVKEKAATLPSLKTLRT